MRPYQPARLALLQPLPHAQPHPGPGGPRRAGHARRPDPEWPEPIRDTWDAAYDTVLREPVAP